MSKLTIGKLAELTGVSADTLRYYEKIKLLNTESRTKSGYRLYHPDSVKIVRFIRGSKALQFTLEEIRQLLAISASDRSTCAEMAARTTRKIAEAETKIQELKAIKRVLSGLIKICPNNDTSVLDCPILDHIRGTVKLTIFAILAACMTLGGSRQAEAKPISYVGGTMIMQENDETGHTLSLDYTIDPHYAVGWFEKWEENEKGGKDFSVHTPEVNTLIHRWNLPDGQANIFNSSGVGVAEGEGKTRAAAWTSFLADYETRRIYGSYEARGMFADTIDQSVWQRARIGVAPYLANYNDVSTWLMLQVDDHPDKTDTLVVTPLVRFFYQSSLAEIGYSSNHHIMFNWQMQF